MSKRLSIIIPARNEPYLIQTIDDVFTKATDPNLQVVAVLDGGDWPVGWAEVVERSEGRLITVHYTDSRGMRNAINAGVDASEGFEYILKCDAHVSFSPGFDTALMDACGNRTVMIPRRYRLDVDSWTTISDGRAPVDYEYISFPKRRVDGMGGRIWNERTIERVSEMISPTPTFQGSCWIMRRDYFRSLMLMDENTYGRFFYEAQEIGLKAWLSGGQVLVNKTVSYAHWHKPKEVGRGYTLEPGLREQAVTGLRRWLTGKGWRKQTMPFSALLEIFPGMPGWTEDWEARIRAQ